MSQSTDMEKTSERTILIRSDNVSDENECMRQGREIVHAQRIAHFGISGDNGDIASDINRSWFGYGSIDQEPGRGKMR